MRVCLVMNATLNSGLPVWEFAVPGPLRERLCGLSLAGAKTATFDIADAESEAKAAEGSRFAMIDSNGTEIAVVDVIDRVKVLTKDVTWEQVQAEGESFTSVEDWRAGHEAFWASIGFHINDETELVFETFRIAEVLPGTSSPRYPIVELTADRDDVELASGELYDLDGLLGIEEVETALTTGGRPVPEGSVVLRVGFSSNESAAAAEASIDRRWSPRFEVLLGDVWLDAWRESFEPLRIGRLVITPAWWDEKKVRAHKIVKKATTDDLVMSLDPERAWGTGAHESTGLILDLLQQHEPTLWDRVLDAGCGSGVLTVAARKLGWQHVHAVDIDRAAREVTMTNAERNQVAAGVSVSDAVWNDLPSGVFGLIMANILAPTLIEVAAELLRVRSKGAPVLLAGLIDTQVEQVTNAFAPLRVHTIRESGVWRGLLLND
jgi:ribosomal protein L11 methyltransferase